jgi:hypothetical protein
VSISEASSLTRRKVEISVKGTYPFKLIWLFRYASWDKFSALK